MSKVKLISPMVLLMFGLMITFSLIIPSCQGADSGVYIRINPKDIYVEGDSITLQFFVSALEDGKVVYSDISVTLKIENETKTMSVPPNTKLQISFGTLKRGIYMGEATASWQSYSITRRFDIMVLPPPIYYSSQFLNWGERFWFSSKEDSNFTITITGWKGGESIPITTWHGSGDFEYYIQSQLPIWEANRERLLKYDVVEITIVDENGWFCYQNGGRSYMWSYRAVEPYESLMFWNAGLIFLFAGGFVLISKRVLGKKVVREVEE